MEPETDTHNAGAARLGSSTANHWAEYARFRTYFPWSLDETILRYCAEHIKRFQLAHDMGAGHGAYSSNLIRNFQRVHVSDVNPAAITAAEERLTEWAEINGADPHHFSFSVGPAEECSDMLAAGSVDLAVMIESAHWTDAEAMVRSAAPVCTVIDNEQVNDAVQRLFNAWGHGLMEAGRPSARRGHRQLNLGLDFVPLPEDLFIRGETRRININTHGRGSEAFRVPGLERLLTEPDAPKDLFACEPSEKRYELSQQDQLGRGWQRLVMAHDFRDVLATLVHSEEMLRRFEPHFLEVEWLIEETSSSGFVRIEWVVAILLATRK